MNMELQDLLMEVGIAMVIGLVVGIAIRFARPEWSRRWTKFALNRQWKLFTLGALFFGSGAVFLWHEGRVYHAMLSLAMCALELVALTLYGFKPLTPEMERKIDQAA